MKQSWCVGLMAVVVCGFFATPALAQSQTDGQNGGQSSGQSGGQNNDQSSSQGSGDSKGDVAAGEDRFYTCRGCHGIPGYSNAYPTFHVPKLGGQHAAYIVAALTDYRENKRKHSTMHAQASSLSDQDIKNIAAYLSQKTPQ